MSAEFAYGAFCAGALVTESRVFVSPLAHKSTRVRWRLVFRES